MGWEEHVPNHTFKALKGFSLCIWTHILCMEDLIFIWRSLLPMALEAERSANRVQAFCYFNKQTFCAFWPARTGLLAPRGSGVGLFVTVMYIYILAFVIWCTFWHVIGICQRRVPFSCKWDIHQLFHTPSILEGSSVSKKWEGFCPRHSIRS
jgi:hypothetical protein